MSVLSKDIKNLLTEIQSYNNIIINKLDNVKTLLNSNIKPTKQKALIKKINQVFDSNVNNPQISYDIISQTPEELINIEPVVTKIKAPIKKMKQTYKSEIDKPQEHFFEKIILPNSNIVDIENLINEIKKSSKPSKINIKKFDFNEPKKAPKKAQQKVSDEIVSDEIAFLDLPENLDITQLLPPLMSEKEIYLYSLNDNELNEILDEYKIKKSKMNQEEKINSILKKSKIKPGVKFFDKPKLYEELKEAHECAKDYRRSVKALTDLQKKVKNESGESKELTNRYIKKYENFLKRCNYLLSKDYIKEYNN